MNGYDTNTPCAVCGQINENKIEPRFGYVVCKEHYHIPPTEVSEIKEKKE